MPVSRQYDDGLAREVSAAAAGGDVVVVEHGWLLGYLPRTGSAVVVLHNVDSELVRELPGRSTAWDVAAYRALERRLARRALVTVVSERDAMRIPGAVVVPNGADVPADVSPVPADGPVVFVGSMGYPPNVAAVEWWVREVWRPELPPLTVVGQNAAAALAHLTGNEAGSGRLRVIGEVPDVTPWLEQARVVAVPVISGSGTRLKVIEGLAHGRPVVTTTKGAEGTGATAEHVLYADAPADFAHAVRRLLDDDELAARLARTGREFAKELSWDAAGDRFVAAVSKVAA
jgi:glycosyltransferase involved in cell wall biosynthesis